MTYAIFVEFMTAKERRDFDKMLTAVPSQAAARQRSGPTGGSRSSGTTDLMAAFGTARR